MKKLLTDLLAAWILINISKRYPNKYIKEILRSPENFNSHPSYSLLYIFFSMDKVLASLGGFMNMLTPSSRFPTINKCFRLCSTILSPTRERWHYNSRNASRSYMSRTPRIVALCVLRFPLGIIECHVLTTNSFIVRPCDCGTAVPHRHYVGST